MQELLRSLEDWEKVCAAEASVVAELQPFVPLYDQAVENSGMEEADKENVKAAVKLIGTALAAYHQSKAKQLLQRADWPKKDEAGLPAEQK